MHLLRRIAASLGMGLLTVIGCSVLLFLAADVLPGDAATRAAGPEATPEIVEQTRRELGLDRPSWVRYLAWMGSAVRGDLGNSFIDGRPVTTVIGNALADSLLLTVLAALLAAVLAMTAGIYCGLRPKAPLARVILATAVTVFSIPSFVLGTVLIAVLSHALGWLPPVSLPEFGQSPVATPEILVLPVLTLAAFSAAWATRMVAALVTDAATAPDVEAARLAGLTERKILVSRILPAVIAPSAQVFGWMTGALFGGTAVVERLFAYPGLSAPLISSVTNHDTPVLEGIGLLMVSVIVLCLVVADLIDTGRRKRIGAPL